MGEAEADQERDEDGDEVPATKILVQKGGLQREDDADEVPEAEGKEGYYKDEGANIIKLQVWPGTSRGTSSSRSMTTGADQGGAEAF